jgi:hypothetical protein
MLAIIPLIVLLVVGVLLLLFALLQSGFERRCPQCHWWWARQDVRTEFMGVFQKKVLVGSRKYRKWVMRPHEKYNIDHRCKYCGHVWRSVVVRRQ